MTRWQRLKLDARANWEAVKGVATLFWSFEKHRLKQDAEYSWRKVEENPILLKLGERARGFLFACIRLRQMLSSPRTILWGIVGFALFSRLYGLAEAPVDNDEALLWYDVLHPESRSLFSYLTIWLPYSLMWLFRDSSELLLRLPNALAGILSVYYIATLGARLGSVSGGLISAALLALSVQHQLWDVTAGSNGLHSLGLLLTLHAFLIARDHSQRLFEQDFFIPEIYRWRAWRVWMLYAFALCLLSNSSVFFVHVIIALALYYTWECLYRPKPRPWRELLLFGAATVAGIVVAGYNGNHAHLLKTVRKPVFDMREPVLQHLQEFTAHLTATPSFEQPSVNFAIAIWSLILSAVLLSVLLEPSPDFRRKRIMVLLVLLLSFVMTLGWVGWRVTQPWSRHTTHLTLLIILFLGLGCGALARIHSILPKLCGVLLLGIVLSQGVQVPVARGGTQDEFQELLKRLQAQPEERIQGIIVEDNPAIIASLGNVYAGSEPFYIVGTRTRGAVPVGPRVFQTEWKSARGAFTQILTKGLQPGSLSAGKYAMTGFDGEFRCVTLLGGSITWRFLETGWALCELQAPPREDT